MADATTTIQTLTDSGNTSVTPADGSTDPALSTLILQNGGDWLTGIAQLTNAVNGIPDTGGTTIKPGAPAAATNKLSSTWYIILFLLLLVVLGYMFMKH